MNLPDPAGKNRQEKNLNGSSTFVPYIEVFNFSSLNFTPFDSSDIKELLRVPLQLILADATSNSPSLWQLEDSLMAAVSCYLFMFLSNTAKLLK